ncbi:MAG: 4-hydroxy-3-methylbut-2-enyl diphosphate reductase, partial [Bacteroidetes bacterium]
MVKVEIDPAAGFCFGVEKVIGEIERMLDRGEEVYGLGEMVHNSEEMQRLRNRGLKTISHGDLGAIRPERILIRAHGEPPDTYRMAREMGIGIIDGTCPIVTRLQQKIRSRYESMDHKSEQLVIFGKKDHPETIGLLGQVGGDATVVSGPTDTEHVDPARRVHLFSQTTMDPEQFRQVEQALRERASVAGSPTMISDCTICGQMKRRKPALEKFARKHDVVIFVSGRSSSNGRMLFEFCRRINPRTYWISGKGEVKPEWLAGAGSAG